MPVLSLTRRLPKIKLQINLALSVKRGNLSLMNTNKIAYRVSDDFTLTRSPELDKTGGSNASRKTYNLSRRYFPEGYETSNGQMIEDEGWYILAGGMWIFDNEQGKVEIEEQT